MPPFKSRLVLWPLLLIALIAGGLILHASSRFSPAVLYILLCATLIILLVVPAISINQLVVDNDRLVIRYPLTIFRKPLQLKLETIKSVVVNPVKGMSGFVFLFNIRNQKPVKRVVVITDVDKRKVFRLLKERGIRIIED